MRDQRSDIKDALNKCQIVGRKQDMHTYTHTHTHTHTHKHTNTQTHTRTCPPELERDKIVVELAERGGQVKRLIRVILKLCSNKMVIAAGVAAAAAGAAAGGGGSSTGFIIVACSSRMFCSRSPIFTHVSRCFNVVVSFVVYLFVYFLLLSHYKL
jgi:hypothetical protein